MKRLKQLVRNLFGFSKTETNGFLILLPLLLIVVFSPFLYRQLRTSPAAPVIQDFYLDSLLDSQQKMNDTRTVKRTTPINPNNSTYEELLDAGFPPPLALRTLNYLKKGGRFKFTEDLLRIYGMDTALFLKILPAIELPAPPTISKKEWPKPEYKKKYTSFDLNLADTSQLQSLYGIGPKLAGRIIAYRQKLGGFVTPGQVSEVYGLDSAVVHLLKSRSFIDADFRPQQLNINSAEEREMARHPYIRPKMAKIIAAYRFQHGTFKEIDDLLHIEIMDSSRLDKLRPYVKVEP